MNYIIKKKIKLSIRILIFLFPISFFLYLFFSDIGHFGNLLSLTKKLFLEIKLGLFLISIGYLIRYIRWRLIINSFGFSPLAKTEFKLWLASYSFTATPGKVGELIRCFFLKKIFNIPFKYSFISIIVERFFDLIAVIIFAFFFFFIRNKALISFYGKIVIVSIISLLFLTFLLKIKNKINKFK